MRDNIFTKPPSINTSIPDRMNPSPEQCGRISSSLPPPPGSPVRVVQPLATTTVHWHCLSDAIKLWIFDSMMPLAPDQNALGQTLGLGELELDQIVFESRKRKVHPHTTDDILAYCVKQSSLGGDVWGKYEEYIEYAARLEEATEFEIQLGVLFLRQRCVPDSIVTALAADLVEETIVWSVTPHIGFDAQLAVQTAAQASNTTHKVPEAFVPTHTPSEEASGTASHFRSCYFPSDGRDRLLRRNNLKAKFIQTWFVYGVVEVDGDRQAEANSQMLERLNAHVLKVDHSTLQCLLVLLSRALQSPMFRATIEAFQGSGENLVNIWIYTVSTYRSLHKMICTAVLKYDLKAWEKKRIIAAACEEVLRYINAEVRTKLDQYIQEENRPVWAPRSNDAAQPIDVEDAGIFENFQGPPISSKSPGKQGHYQVPDLPPINTSHVPSSSPALPTSQLGTPFLSIDEYGHASISEHSSDVENDILNRKRRRISNHSGGISLSPSYSQQPTMVAQPSSAHKSAWVDGSIVDFDVYDQVSGAAVDPFDTGSGFNASIVSNQGTQLLPQLPERPQPSLCNGHRSLRSETHSALTVLSHVQKRSGLQQSVPWASSPAPATVSSSAQHMRQKVMGVSMGIERERECSLLESPYSTFADEGPAVFSPLLQENAAISVRNQSISSKTHPRPRQKNQGSITLQAPNSTVTDFGNVTNTSGKTLKQRRAQTKRTRPEPLQTGTPWLPDSIVKLKNRDTSDTFAAHNLPVPLLPSPLPLQSLTPNRIQVGFPASNSRSNSPQPSPYSTINNITSSIPSETANTSTTKTSTTPLHRATSTDAPSSPGKSLIKKMRKDKGVKRTGTIYNTKKRRAEKAAQQALEDTEGDIVVHAGEGSACTDKSTASEEESDNDSFSVPA